MVFLWGLRASRTLFTTTSANVKHSEVSFLADLRASCTLFTATHGNVNYSEVSFFEQTSVRPAHYLQQLMRFGGPADSGLYNTK